MKQNLYNIETTKPVDVLPNVGEPPYMNEVEKVNSISDCQEHEFLKTKKFRCSRMTNHWTQSPCTCGSEQTRHRINRNTQRQIGLMIITKYATKAWQQQREQIKTPLK